MDFYSKRNYNSLKRKSNCHDLLKMQITQHRGEYGAIDRIHDQKGSVENP